MDDAERLLDAGRLVATLDQVGAGLEELAELLGDYRQKLIAAGFAECDAVELCFDVQRVAIFSAAGTDPRLD